MPLHNFRSICQKEKLLFSLTHSLFFPSLGFDKFEGCTQVRVDGSKAGQMLPVGICRLGLCECVSTTWEHVLPKCIPKLAKDHDPRRTEIVGIVGGRHASWCDLFNSAFNIPPLESTCLSSAEEEDGSTCVQVILKPWMDKFQCPCYWFGCHSPCFCSVMALEPLWIL